MTWKQFKDFLEQNGVKDDMEIDFIDITYPLPGIDADCIEINTEDNSFNVA